MILEYIKKNCASHIKVERKGKEGKKGSIEERGLIIYGENEYFSIKLIL